MDILSFPRAAAPSLPLADLMATPSTLPFIVQPLLQPHSNELFGFEVLYRGVHPADRNWTAIDAAVLRSLGESKVRASLFVNLSNDTILTIDEGILFEAARTNAIYFEWSEAVAGDWEFKAIVDKVNKWTRAGLRFIIDDFGAGRDGLERLFAVDAVTAVKFDGGFFRTARTNQMAGRMIEHIVAECAHRNILTVGECVETESDYRFAASLGLDLAQGYFVDDLYAAAKLNKPTR